MAITCDLGSADSVCLFLPVHLNKISGDSVFSTIQVAVQRLPAKPLIKKLMYNMMAAEKPLSGTDAVSSQITLALRDYSCGGSAAQKVTFSGTLSC